MEIDEKNVKGEGFKPYYITKIEELQLIVTEKSQNLRRLQAQRNELNAKGTYPDDGNIIVIFRKARHFFNYIRQIIMYDYCNVSYFFIF